MTLQIVAILLPLKMNEIEGTRPNSCSQAFARWNQEVRSSRMVFKYFSSGLPKHSLLKYFTLTFMRHKSSKFEGSGPPLMAGLSGWRASNESRRTQATVLGHCQPIDIRCWSKRAKGSPKGSLVAKGEPKKWKILAFFRLLRPPKGWQNLIDVAFITS